MNRTLWWCGLWLGAWLLRAGPADAAWQDPGGGFCVACDGRVDGLHLEIHQGRRVWACEGMCAAKWHAEPEVLFADLQARGGLHDERSLLGDLVSGWMWFGVYVLAGLVAGGACAYLAVSRGLPALPWFFAGLFGNLLALGVLLTRPAAARDDLPAGIPPGLRKVPTTRAPRICPHCGAPNHPAARACTRCHGALEAAATAEWERI